MIGMFHLPQACLSGSYTFCLRRRNIVSIKAALRKINRFMISLLKGRSSQIFTLIYDVLTGPTVQSARSSSKVSFLPTESLEIKKKEIPLPQSSKITPQMAGKKNIRQKVMEKMLTQPPVYTGKRQQICLLCSPLCVFSFIKHRRCSEHPSYPNRAL